MSTILNLDEYAKNRELTLDGKKYTMPPITLKVRNSLIELYNKIMDSKDDKTKIHGDITLLSIYLNTNLEKNIFKVEQLEEIINLSQVKVLTEFVMNQIRGSEKN